MTLFQVVGPAVNHYLWPPQIMPLVGGQRMMHEKHHHSLLLLSVSAQNFHDTIASLSVTLCIDFLVI